MPKRTYKKKWNEGKIQFLKDNFDKMSYVEISKILCISRSNISLRANMLGLRKSLRWTKNEVEYLKNNYGKISIGEITDFLKTRNEMTIRAKSHSLGLLENKIRYSCNESFFLIPNICNSYWAGFIAADGCIEKNNLLGVGLAKKDECILEGFKKDICFNGPIKTYQTKRGDKIHESVRIRITSEQIVNDLEANYNICPRKSLILKPPLRLNYSQSLAFIRGYIDGDGYISFPREKCRSRTISILGSLEFLIWIKDIFNKICNFDKKIKIKKVGKIYRISFNRVRDIEKILKSLKCIDTFCLKRKWENIKPDIITFNIKDFLGGWYCGAFKPASFITDKFECGYKSHKAGENWDKHVHKVATEINFLLRGKLKIRNNIIFAGSVFIIFPNEIADPEFLEDCEIFTIKTPGVLNDKYVISSN